MERERTPLLTYPDRPLGQRRSGRPPQWPGPHGLEGGRSIGDLVQAYRLMRRAGIGELCASPSGAQALFSTPMYNEMLDLSHCLRKEMEFYAKADSAPDAALKSAYEAAAREYHHRAILLKSANTP